MPADKFTMINPMDEHLRFYSELIPEGSLCFDVGANHGEKTAALLCFASTVIAVEPQENLARFIESSLRLEVERGRLIVLPCALGSATGEAVLHRALDPYQSMSTLSNVFRDISVNNGDSWDDSLDVTVGVITLDQLVSRFGVPAYIKIDVEGYDFEVLKGLSHPVDLISFEFNLQPGLLEVALDCLDHVEKLGDYVFNIQIYGQEQFHLSRWISSGVLGYLMQHDLPRNGPGFGDIFARKAGSPNLATGNG